VSRLYRIKSSLFVAKSVFSESLLFKSCRANTPSRKRRRWVRG